MITNKNISTLIKSQFPVFYREQGPNFIAFVQSYYEWLEQQGNVTNLTRSMFETMDIDKTAAEFVVHFKNKYIANIPNDIMADKRLLVKHIIDLYRSKGNENSYRLLFRILFNEDIDFYVPSEYMFKPSDNTWYVPNYIEVSDSPYLQQLVGHPIYSSGRGTAVVEDYNIKIIKGKTVNILHLSNIEGSFQFGEEIYSNDFPDLNIKNAPIIFGSLSTVSVTSGGYNYEIGDLLDVTGSGFAGVARVASTINQNGKVAFKLVNGGQGFSRTPNITITGGSGAGASFQVGGITDTQIVSLNTDSIDGLKNTLLDIGTEGLYLNITSASGTFNNNEYIRISANTRHADVTQVYGVMSSGESISNSALGITGLTVYNSDGNMIYFTGTDLALENANLAPGVILVSNTSSSLVQINALFDKVTVSGNGVVNSYASNTTVLTLFNSTADIGYFIPGTTVTGLTSGKTAIVAATRRLTNWGSYFPAGFGNENLDSNLGNTLRFVTKEIGTITFLNNINPGIGYSSDPVIEIVEPLVYDLRIPDGNGGYLGFDSVVTGKAGVANGIVTGVTIYDSGLGYIPNENVILSNATNPAAVSGTTVIDLNGVSAGSYKNTKSFLSETMKIQDSDFYQAFSYRITAARMVDTYRKFVLDLVHPAGFKLFGAYALKSELTEQNSEAISFTLNNVSYS
jgi:hypothetical protein